MANPIFSTISVEYSRFFYRGRWQSEMKKNSKLGHEREQSSKKRVENTTRNCGKRDQSSRCHHLFSITFRSPENGDIQGDPTSFR